ncbi:MAG: hypothetical protein WC972_13510, partial [Trueperaceae bacterium]
MAHAALPTFGGCAHDGSDHDGTTLPDTDDPTVAGTQRGDPTETIYDGFDRVVTTIDAMGYQGFTGCACSGGGGGPNAYDPDGNVLTRSAIGPAGDNLRGGGMNDKLLSRSRSLFDELSRVYRSEQDYWRTPQPVTTPSVEAVYVSKTLYDRSSRAIKQIRPMGDFVELEHDGLGRVIRRKTSSMTGSAGTLVPSEVITRYDDAGNVVQTAEIERSVVTGSVLTFYTDTFYDAVGRPELVVSPHFSGNTANATRTEYDSRGNAVATLDANASGTTTIGVNRGGSLTLTINSTGNAVIQLHDGLGRVLATVRELRQGHDGSNSLDTSNPRNDDGLITTLQDWDANSRLVSVTDDEDTSVSPSSTNPSTTTFGYDDLDRRTTQTNADSEQQATVYDLDGHATSFTDENGSVITRTYDDLGRVTVVSVNRATGVEGTTTQTCEYDGLSRKTFCTDDNGLGHNSEVTSSYDSLSRLQESTQKVGSAAARTVTSEFDQNSNLIQLTYPGRIGGGSPRQVTYGYRDGSGNTLNRIELIEEGAGSGSGNAIVPVGTGSLRIATFGYIGPVRVASRQYGDGNTGAGVLMTKQYDALRRNTRVTHNDATTLGDFVDVEYAFDKNGNRLNEVFHHEGASGVQDVYRYDSVGRLIREDRSATVGGITNNQAANPTATASENRTWDGLDGANNWNSVTGSGGFASLSITANEMNEYTVVNSVSRSHDDNGNLVDDGSKEYVYDAFNRLVRVV